MREQLSQLQSVESKLQTEIKLNEDLQSEKDDFRLRFEQIQDYLKGRDVVLPEALHPKVVEKPQDSTPRLKRSQTIGETSTNQKKSILDEQK